MIVSSFGLFLYIKTRWMKLSNIFPLRLYLTSFSLFFLIDLNYKTVLLGNNIFFSPMKALLISARHVRQVLHSLQCPKMNIMNDYIIMTVIIMIMLAQSLLYLIIF